MIRALDVRVRGVVQGVGLRPYVFRLATERALAGWVRNDPEGVDIHVEGADDALERFIADLVAAPPAAAVIAGVEAIPAAVRPCESFEIRDSALTGFALTRVSPDLAVCDACLAETMNPGDRRRGYPYTNCSDCGPRFSILRQLPYDRAHTTMAPWPMCETCAAEYAATSSRRFHAQPIACTTCGPHYQFVVDRLTISGDASSIACAAKALSRGDIVAIKGIGGYHLACDAVNNRAVHALRERKFRKEKPFAVMARDLETARKAARLDHAAVKLLCGSARPVVLAPALISLEQVAPASSTLGIMLPYAPLHHLLFAAGAPALLVMTSGNRSSEPIAYQDDDALEKLHGIADGFLVGERPIARRLDDSVVRVGPLGPTVLRRSRGMTPGVVAEFPPGPPILAIGADLKNTVTLVVNGQAYGGPHIGDLDAAAAFDSFRHCVDDLMAIYGVRWNDVIVAYDPHPQYASTRYAQTLPVVHRLAVQHHRAHIASVVAERSALDRHVLGIAFDGTGYGDDGAIWGGEFFAGSAREGFERVASIRQAMLPGGDAAASDPVQAAAGWLGQLTDDVDLCSQPFEFPRRYRQASMLVDKDVRAFPTHSAGRLFDVVAALLGFMRRMSFEGQAAMWLEHLAHGVSGNEAFCLPFADGELDWRPALAEIVKARRSGVPVPRIARSFHLGLARSVAGAAAELARERGLTTVVLSGGVFQNQLLLDEVVRDLTARRLRVWLNHRVPPNDGGISLGQAAMASGMAV
jgi:hydrogenase maturation protein HypF